MGQRSVRISRFKGEVSDKHSVYEGGSEESLESVRVSSWIRCQARLLYTGNTVTRFLVIGLLPVDHAVY
jgi:hypothetical protein